MKPTITLLTALLLAPLAALGAAGTFPAAEPTLGADYTVVFDHAAGIPMESGFVRTDAPSLARTSDGALLCTVPMWDANTPLPKAAELPQVNGAKFYVLKKPRPDEDGSNFTLGVGLAWHKDKLYASYGFSTSEQENTADEEAHVRVSEDGGKTWGQPVAMDAGEGNLGVSHGVFLSHGGRLWAFMGAFYDNFYGPTSRTHTRGYVLNETSGKWEAQGVVLDQGFWPMQEPQQMADGNWIMSGVRIAFGSQSAKGMTSRSGKWSSFRQTAVWERRISGASPL